MTTDITLPTIDPVLVLILIMSPVATAEVNDKEPLPVMSNNLPPTLSKRSMEYESVFPLKMVACMTDLVFVSVVVPLTVKIFALAAHVMVAILDPLMSFNATRFSDAMTFPVKIPSLAMTFPVVVTSPLPFTVNGVVAPFPAIQFMNLKSVPSAFTVRMFITDEANAGSVALISRTFASAPQLDVIAPVPSISKTLTPPLLASHLKNEYAFVSPRTDDKYTRVFEYEPIVEFIVNTLSFTGVVAMIAPVPVTSNTLPKVLSNLKNE